MLLQLVKSRFDGYLKFGFIKHSLIVLTIVTTVVNIDKCDKHCNIWHQYFESATNTTTNIESQKYGFGENLKRYLPMIKCTAYIIFEAMYNLIFLVIIIKEILKVVSTFIILEFFLIFFSKITRVSFHKTSTITNNEYLLWYYYLLNMYCYLRVLKYKIKVKRKNGIEKAPPVVVYLWPLLLFFFTYCVFF